VAKTAVEIAESHIRRGVNVDLALVRSGALLHDIGRSATAKVKHGAEGGRILREAGFSEDLARIAERHVGAGIPKKRQRSWGFPRKIISLRLLRRRSSATLTSLSAEAE